MTWIQPKDIKPEILVPDGIHRRGMVCTWVCRVCWKALSFTVSKIIYLSDNGILGKQITSLDPTVPYVSNMYILRSRTENLSVTGQQKLTDITFKAPHSLLGSQISTIFNTDLAAKWIQSELRTCFHDTLLWYTKEGRIWVIIFCGFFIFTSLLNTWLSGMNLHCVLQIFFKSPITWRE